MQQKSLRDDCLAETNVNFVKKQNKSNFSKIKGTNLKHDESSIPGNSQAWYQAGGAKACTRCGSPKFHKFEHCPAFNATCRRCSKKGHFIKQCKTKLVSQVTTKVDNEKFLGNFCIDQISSDERWNCKVAVNKRIMPFKIDTGADVSVMPENCFKQNFLHQLGKTQKRLYAAGMAMPVLGNFQATLEANGKVSHEEIYVIKNFPVSLLSAKASEELGFIQRLLHDYPELFSGLGKLNKPYKIELNDQAQPYAIHTHTVVTAFSTLTSANSARRKKKNWKFGYAIHTPRRIPFPLINKIKQKLKEMEQQGVIEKVDHATDWCSPMVIVPKKNNEIRICVDLTKLNEKIKRERYQMPILEETLNQLSNGKVFSKLYANSGFWQIPLDDKSKDFTTFLTPFGRYRFCRPPFGITSAPKHFQKRMNEVLRDIEGSMCHLDDIIVWGSNQQEHDGRLKQVLSTLKETGLTLNKEKCVFSSPKLKFLGHQIGPDGLKPDEKKIRAIIEMPSPQNVTELKRFLGMINYLSRFIPSLAERAHPLYSLLSQKNDWFWGDNQVKAFETLKKALSSFPTLAMYNPSYKTFITTDASSFGLGAYLSQINGKNQRQIIAYASRSLSETEHKYAQIEKEALALTWAMDKFKNYIISLEVELETDHKPLISIFSTKALEDLSPRIQRMKFRMMQYSFIIKYIPGKKNILADVLSCAPRNASDKWIKEIAVHQSKDPTIQRVKSYVQDHWPDKSKLSQKEVEFWHVRNDLIIINNLLMKGCRYVVPGSLRSEILSRIHEGHQGNTKCRRMRESFYWPKSYKDVEQMVLNCNECIKKKQFMERTNYHDWLLR
ncbi:K02A2.6-like [Cordylochernes scorpioides]|uniref:RNA-directed DNA polymerase n=1 Tax=Cordylochernes scorpioides TaxID=51811 RepID=A0ABY6KN96_9ARAC|nr:K02A2.6-like [Cordylochernes scorpioides]